MLFLFLSFGISSVYYRNCSQENDGQLTCRQVQWNTSRALIPCNLVGREFRVCSSHGLEKFQDKFPDVSPDILTGDGCDGNYRDINRFGLAVCQPLNGVVCTGERYWIVKDHRCFEEGTTSYITVFVCSLFFGLFGVDRYLLGYPFLATIKLLTVGGVGIWYLVDLILIALGKLTPFTSDYRNSY